MTVIAQGCGECNPVMFSREDDPAAITVDRVYLDADGQPFPSFKCKVFLDGEVTNTVRSVMPGEGAESLALRFHVPATMCPCGSERPMWFLDAGPYVVEPAGLRAMPEAS